MTVNLIHDLNNQIFDFTSFMNEIAQAESQMNPNIVENLSTEPKFFNLL